MHPQEPPAACTSLDGALLRRWLDAAADGLLASREAIDRVNVYPVPDGDTGTNLHLTVVRARDEVHAMAAGEAVGEVARSAARGALVGARGNSGVILSQLLLGWADALHGVHVADAFLVAAAFARADEQAWAAVEEPVEGTILSASRAASQAAAAATAGAGNAELARVVTVAAAAAREALGRTTGQLDVLAGAGVVDAGAAGLVVVLDALARVVTGAVALPALDGTSASPGPAALPESPAFEVMYLLDAGPQEVASLRSRLAGLGDSLAVVGDAGLWSVHLHTDEPGAAIEAGIAAGRPHAISISHFPERAGGGTRAPDAVAVVACSAGAGLGAAFAAAGCVALPCPAGSRTSSRQLLAAVRSAGTRAVVILPNDPQTLEVARAVAATAGAEGLVVTVVPTRAQVQGLAAAAVHDPATGVEQAVAAMTAAAAHTRHGAVVVQAATQAGGSDAAVLGLLDGEVAVAGADLEQVALELLARVLAGGGELVTLVSGRDAPPGLADAVAREVRSRHAEVEVVVLDGGHAGVLLVGVE